MRINLTKQEIVNSIYMQIGYSKKISENLLEDLLSIILDELIKNKKVKIPKFGTFIIRKKKELEETQKQKNQQLYPNVKLFFLNHRKN